MASFKLPASLRSDFIHIVGIAIHIVGILSGGASVIDRLVGEVRKLPEELWPAIRSHWSRPECFESMAQHLTVLPATAKAAATAGELGNLPLTVISGAHLSAEALEEHWKLSRLSSRGKHVIASAGGHWVLFDEPETVVRAVREIVTL